MNRLRSLATEYWVLDQPNLGTYLHFANRSVSGSLNWKVFHGKVRQHFFPICSYFKHILLKASTFLVLSICQGVENNRACATILSPWTWGPSDKKPTKSAPTWPATWWEFLMSTIGQIFEPDLKNEKMSLIPVAFFFFLNLFNKQCKGLFYTLYKYDFM